MTTENQPIDRRITVYIPENWIQPTAGSGTGSFINYPTAQTALISFPGSILCSNFQSFAPTAPMNLLNNSTTGNIQFANNSGYSGGIVINADGTVPVSNKIIIGDSARALVAPLLHTTEIYGTGAFAGQVNVNADFQVANGYGLYSNFLEQYTGGVLTICGQNGVRLDIGTGASRNDNINIGTGMTISGNLNLGSTAGGININGRLEKGLTLDYSPTTIAGIDTFMGGYKEGSYQPATPFTQSINTIEQRIIGSISSLLSVGVYQLNVNSSLSTSLLNPYLVFGIFYKTPTGGAWVNGNVRGGIGFEIDSLNRVNTYPTTNALTDVFTLSMSGLLTLTLTGYIAVVVSNANPALSQNITFIDTYLSVVRVG